MNQHVSRRTLVSAAASSAALGVTTAATARVVADLPVPQPEPSTSDILEAYGAWLYHERRILMINLYGKDKAREALEFVPANTLASDFHFPTFGKVPWDKIPQPTSRARLVLETVGVDFRPLRDRV